MAWQYASAALAGRFVRNEARQVGPVVARHVGTLALRKLCTCAALSEPPSKNSASPMMKPPSAMDDGRSAARAGDGLITTSAAATSARTAVATSARSDRMRAE